MLQLRRSLSYSSPRAMYSNSTKIIHGESPFIKPPLLWLFEEKKTCCKLKTAQENFESGSIALNLLASFCCLTVFFSFNLCFVLGCQSLFCSLINLLKSRAQRTLIFLGRWNKRFIVLNSCLYKFCPPLGSGRL